MKSDKMYFQSLWIVFLGLLLTGCSEDFLLEHELLTNGEKEEVVISPPCEYTNEANFEGYLGMSGGIGLEVRKSFDDTEVRCGFSTSSNVIVFTVNSRYGLDAIESQVIDYSEVFGIVSMHLAIYDGSNFSFNLESGKLYIERLAENKLKFTWCDIVFKERSSSFRGKCYGSRVVTYE